MDCRLLFSKSNRDGFSYWRSTKRRFRCVQFDGWRNCRIGQLHHLYARILVFCCVPKSNVPAVVVVLLLFILNDWLRTISSRSGSSSWSWSDSRMKRSAAIYGSFRRSLRCNASVCTPLFVHHSLGGWFIKCNWVPHSKCVIGTLATGRARPLNMPREFPLNCLLIRDRRCQAFVFWSSM